METWHLMGDVRLVFVVVIDKISIWGFMMGSFIYIKSNKYWSLLFSLCRGFLRSHLEFFRNLLSGIWTRTSNLIVWKDVSWGIEVKWGKLWFKVLCYLYHISVAGISSCHMPSVFCIVVIIECISSLIRAPGALWNINLGLLAILQLKSKTRNYFSPSVYKLAAIVMNVLVG